MKKALCFSGGGIKAFAHIGALKALEEKNFKKDIKMPIAVPAVNLQNGEVIIFSSKEIRQNISDEIKNEVVNGDYKNIEVLSMMIREYEKIVEEIPNAVASKTIKKLSYKKDNK